MLEITCREADELRIKLNPLSSLTNYIADEVLNPDLPPHTATTWGHHNGTEVMREVLDADGCRHYRIESGDSDD